jgi:uracil phosphoribosyltransferase
MNKVILKAEELDGYLTDEDNHNLKNMALLFERAMELFPKIQNDDKNAKNSLISVYNDMGALIQEICHKNQGLDVFSFNSVQENQNEVSRIIAKLRDPNTKTNEFIYYIQRSYEMLFKKAFLTSASQKNHLVVKTPVSFPAQNYAVHKITNIDNKIGSSVMCVMLRGALLPSMIMSKEIEEYSSNGYITPFALFKIYRNDKKLESNMEYILDLDKSHINFDELDGKDLIFADPMNATGGSLITIIRYLSDMGIKPRSIMLFNVICALKGALKAVRALENCSIYTLWMDSLLNKDAYIMPGLGDAGDRINGEDSTENPRNIIQLLADYGTNVTDLYPSQVREIKKAVLENNK